MFRTTCPRTIDYNDLSLQFYRAATCKIEQWQFMAREVTKLYPYISWYNSQKLSYSLLVGCRNSGKADLVLNRIQLYCNRIRKARSEEITCASKQAHDRFFQRQPSSTESKIVVKFTNCSIHSNDSVERKGGLLLNCRRPYPSPRRVSGVPTMYIPSPLGPDRKMISMALPVGTSGTAS